MTSRFFRNLLLGVVLVCCYAISYNALLNQRTSHAAQAQSTSAWALPPLVLKVLAGEFKGLIADLIVLEVGAQLGTEVVRDPRGGLRTIKKEYDWPAVHQLFVNSQALDPAFAQTFILAQGHLPWEPANMVAETQDILKIAAQNRPWDWQPAHIMGFNNYYFLDNPGEAGKIFLAAARDVPHAPPFLAILGARLAQKGGETASAIALMESMLEGKPETDPDYQEMMERYQALQGVLVLEEAVKRYTAKFGRAPGSLDDLMLFGILTSLPANPYKVDYCMDEAGKIYFDNPKCRTAAGAPPADSGQEPISTLP